MKRVFTWLASAERNEKAYWIGLFLMFVGLTWSSTVFVALTVVGTVMIIESIATSYLAGWINSRNENE